MSYSFGSAERHCAVWLLCVIVALVKIEDPNHHNRRKTFSFSLLLLHPQPFQWELSGYQKTPPAFPSSLQSGA